MITRYTRRTATSGNATLCSARKDKTTLIHWFYIDMGGVWALIDIRQVAKRYSQVFVAEAANAGQHYEKFLQAELQRAADFCNEVGFGGSNVPTLQRPAHAQPVPNVALSEDWARCEAISDLPDVDEAFMGFNDDPTADNATCLVREILKAVGL